MTEHSHDLEQQVETIIRASFAQQQPEEPDTTTSDDTRERQIIDVDLYRLEGGAVLLVPNTGNNPLDTNAIESVAPSPSEHEVPITGTPTVPLVDEGQQEEELPQDALQGPASPGTQRRGRTSFVLVPLVLLCLLTAGTGSYLYLLPLAASATVMITPKARMLQTGATLLIATHPNASQVQGRRVATISLTKSKTLSATGHGHDDATRATGVITFYNADSQSYTIPAGTSFPVQGVTVVTDASVTVQAVVPPMLGTAFAPAHVIQTGSAGNIAAHAVFTRCCGSAFLTATNTSAFTGGQDAKDYSFIQSSDIHNTASDLVAGLTPRTIEALANETRTGERLVPPLCTPRTQASAVPGTQVASVTVSVTQTCSSVAYLTDSLNQVATSVLAHHANLISYQQAGTVQVTVNGSTYQSRSAALRVTLQGIWVYHFTQAQLTQLTRSIAGKNQQEAQATLERVDGIAQVSIHLQRLDFRDLLPTNPQRISIQFFSLVT